MTDNADTVEKIQGINLVPEPTKPYLNKRQLVDYRDHREKLIKWCLNLGKDPEKAEATHTPPSDNAATGSTSSIAGSGKNRKTATHST